MEQRLRLLLPTAAAVCQPACGPPLTRLHVCWSMPPLLQGAVGECASAGRKRDFASIAEEAEEVPLQSEGELMNAALAPLGTMAGHPTLAGGGLQAPVLHAAN